MESEKSALLPTTNTTSSSSSTPARKKTTRPNFLPCILLLLLTTWILKFPLLYYLANRGYNEPPIPSFKSQCQQQDPLFPSVDNDRLQDMYDFLSTDEFRKGSITRHAAAVQIPTESFDDMGPIGQDPRWEIMYKFQDYLKNTFPRVHAHMNPEKVNTHGLLYTYQGSDKSLKPLLLMAHYDVVPVPNATVGSWTHPPFSGYYDGNFIWGRGSSDCKNQLVAVMETMELFLDAGFKPRRTIVLSFGFDEEVSGPQGASHLAPYLLDRYGKGGLAAIVDEGSQFQKAWGVTFAVPGTGEKGYTDVEIVVRMPGGHSSVPVDHTSIGVLSELITHIEADQYRTYLAGNNPYLSQLQCGAAHAKKFPDKLRHLLGKHDASTSKAKPDLLALEAAKQGRRIQYLMQTSQAVDVIGGGVKVNALPERVAVTVNHRVNIGDEPEIVWDRLASIAKRVADKYKLKLHAFDGVDEEAESISLSHDDETLRVAPTTPTNVDTNTPYKVLSGTIRAVYGDDIIVSPGMTTGNTDTKFYWDLTKHIFRFGPGYDPEFDSGELNNVHTVDEHISVKNHIGMVKWFTMFVRNMDEADLDD